MESLITSCLCILAMLLTAAKALYLFPLQCARRCTCRHLPWRSGDVLLFSLSGLKEDLLKFCFHSHITHVGMVVTDTAGRRYVWEATRRGCALVPLESYKLRGQQRVPVPRAARPARARSALWRSRARQPGAAVQPRLLAPRLQPLLPVPAAGHARAPPHAVLYRSGGGDAGARGRAGLCPTDRTPADVIPSDFTEKQQDLPLTAAYSYDSEIAIAC